MSISLSSSTSISRHSRPHLLCADARGRKQFLGGERRARVANPATSAPGQSEGCVSFLVGAVLRPDGDYTLVFVPLRNYDVAPHLGGIKE